MGTGADPPLLGSSPWPAALRATVNGAVLAKDKLFLQGMYSYTVQEQPGTHFAWFSLSLPLRGKRAAGFPCARSSKHSRLGSSLGSRSEPPSPPTPRSKPSPCLPFLSAESERTICYLLVPHLPFN